MKYLTKFYHFLQKIKSCLPSGLVLAYLFSNHNVKPFPTAACCRHWISSKEDSILFNCPTTIIRQVFSWINQLFYFLLQAPPPGRSRVRETLGPGFPPQVPTGNLAELTSPVASPSACLWCEDSKVSTSQCWERPWLGSCSWHSFLPVHSYEEDKDDSRTMLTSRGYAEEPWLTLVLFYFIFKKISIYSFTVLEARR